MPDIPDITTLTGVFTVDKKKNLTRININIFLVFINIFIPASGFKAT